MDITTTRGLLAVVKQCLRLKPAGLLWGGNPCSNQVFMSSSVHGRKRDDPMGDQSLRSDWSDLALEVRLLKCHQSDVLMCSPLLRCSGGERCEHTVRDSFYSLPQFVECGAVSNNLYPVSIKTSHTYNTCTTCWVALGSYLNGKRYH